MTAALKPRAETALLLGASGFLGPALCDAFDPAEAIATHFHHATADSVFFDARCTPVADLVTSMARPPKAGVLLFGETAIDECARDPEGSAAVNVSAAIRVIDELLALGIVPVFVSSDAVFDGSRALWSESDPPHPILTYGWQKVEVEQYIMSLPPPWLVVRLPKLLAAQRNPRCILTGWVDALGRKESILCATDQFFTPASTADVAGAIALMIREGAQGLFHLGGPNRISRRKLLELVSSEFRKLATIRASIQECSLRDLPVAEPRPLDTSLSSTRFEDTFSYRFRDVATIVRASVRSCFSASTSLLG